MHETKGNAGTAKLGRFAEWFGLFGRGSWFLLPPARDHVGFSKNLLPTCVKMLIYVFRLMLGLLCWLALVAFNARAAAAELSITTASNSAVVSFSSDPGQTYAVESSSTLTNWNSLKEGIVGDGASKIAIVTNALAAPRGFFRLSQHPTLPSTLELAGLLSPIMIGTAGTFTVNT